MWLLSSVVFMCGQLLDTYSATITGKMDYSYYMNIACKKICYVAQLYEHIR